MATSDTVVYSNSQTAQDDYFTLSANDLSATWNVMSNDGGGTKTTLYSLDDGTNDSALTPIGGIKFDMDLLTQDAIDAKNATSGGSMDLAGGWAEIDGRTGVVTYSVDAGSALATYITSLGVGESYDDSFVYAIKNSNGTLSQATVHVHINGVNDAPVIDSGATGTEAENTAITNVVYQATATDPEADTITWSLTGADAALFDIDSSTGAVTFKAPPNFEAPADLGGDNVYNIIVTATDGGSLSDSQAVAISVTDENEAPTITSGASATTPENVSTTTVVYDANATDPDAGDTLTYSFGGGADDGLFDIDGATGAVTFQAPPDFEAPADLGGDNVYNIIVTATDGGSLSDSQAVAISVTDENEGLILPTTCTDTDDPNNFDSLGNPADGVPGDFSGSVIYGGGGNDHINGTNGDDLIYGGSDNDDINGNNGIDTIYGGSGNDTITGSNQNDVIIGGYGADILTGGGGSASNDTFKFLDLCDTNDIITDFNDAGDDTFDFSAIDSGNGVDGVFAWGGQQTGAVVVAHGITWYQSGGDVVVLADTDGVLTSAEFAVTLTGTTTLAQADFIL
ncbi:MAG TPA: cadherin domain-containing protein [Stellaceae bacterium]|nr:cadherin domain-containing protein [Stellaceae bacterium]